ncbi:carboxypeptidase-like regulatory domain-containing protein [Flammeovirga sp. SJP92]|uniref:carboxypeptidase-like regulatory domain-containing protein n=1 Tax=Flammeovirga sp. SJP92 TaxID=1775430 RepID=UPI000786C96D|nr:carboxypeptidase-like regulatory domain-containing protein [Flammeovirga sp. SJP92]KXX70758.1 hypothetical protein AVL50_08050 [Flammeovirga sp. SJP92]
MSVNTNKFLFLFLTISLLLLLQVKGQITISGTVINSDNEPIVGAYISEEGTKDVVISDFDGNFTLKLNEPATLLIRTLGYVDQRIYMKGDTDITIEMKEDTNQIYCLAYYYGLTSETGFNYGASNSTFGIESFNEIRFLPFINNYIPMNANLRWRRNHYQSYFNLSLYRDNIIRLHYHKISIGLEGNFKTLNLENSYQNQYLIAPSINLHGFYLAVGYAYRNHSMFEEEISQNGLRFNIRKSLLYNLFFEMGGVLWEENDFQCNLNLRYKLLKNKLIVGAGWEIIDDWQEFDISLSYKIEAFKI